MSIIVYILTDNPESHKVQRTSSLFENDSFQVNVCNIRPPKDTVAQPHMSTADMTEFYRFTWCLNDAQTKWPSSYVIVAQDTCVSSADTDTIADAIRQTMTKKKWDVLYLCRWLDKCEDNTDVDRLDGYTSYIVRTFSPHGLQALMFSPTGRDKVLGDKAMSNGKLFAKKDVHPLDSMLNHHINEGDLTAYALGNNLLEYDLSQARDRADFVRMTQCQIASSSTTSDSSTNFSVWWYVVIVAFIAVIILVVVLITKESSRSVEHPMLAS